MENATPLLADVKERLRDGKLTGYRCTSCGHMQATPIFVCPKDGGRKVELVDLPETGVVVTRTIQAVSSEEFINDVPFAFVVVELDNGVRTTGWVADIRKPDDLPLGAKVRFTPSYKPGVQFEKA